MGKTKTIEEPPISRLLWVIYNRVSYVDGHDSHLSATAKKLCEKLQHPYWRIYQAWKYPSI